MKSIKKITDKVTNNVSSLAGSALLVGATLTGGAAFAAAQSGSSGSSMDLGDYPQPFVTEDGEVDTSIVIGSDAATIDVVGAVEIAGSLGNAAFGEESVSVSAGGVSGSWSAENGITLNRQNSDLFLNDKTDAEETRLSEGDLNVLETTNFRSEDDEEVDVEHEVEIGSQNQGFYAAGDNDDPLLHVVNPTNPSSGDNLFTATVEFSETMDFEEAGSGDDGSSVDGDEWIEDGDEIEMFGTEYTFSDESDSSELVFYGSSDRVEVNTGESTTVTVDGEEVQLESTYVGENGDSATVVVGGQTENVEEGDSVGPNGNVRISDIYRTGPDGQGRVAFSQGSQELIIDDQGDVEVDGDDLDGVQVTFDGTTFNQLDGMNFHFGAPDSDEDYIEAGEMYEDPLFGMEFHYGGLSGDTAENPAEAIQLTAAEDGNAEVTVNDPSGDSADVTFATVDESTGNVLAHDDGETYATVEGETLEEDDRVVLNSNEEAGLYEVTDITNEADLSGGQNFEDEDFAVTLENVVTGDSVEIEETEISGTDDEVDSNNETVTLESESIEGKDFNIEFNDNGVAFTRTGESSTQVFPTLYTSSDAGMVFAQETQLVSGATDDPADEVAGSLEMPSTAISGDVVVDYEFNETSTAPDVWTLDIGGETVTANEGGSNTSYLDVEAGQVDYTFTVSSTGDAADGVNLSVGVDQDQQSVDESNAAFGASVGVIQPEDDEDEEHAYFFDPDVADGSDGSFDEQYTGVSQRGISEGTDISEDGWVTNDLDSEDNVEVGYNDYGAYTMFDTDDDAEYNLHLPAGQSTAGMAVTGTDGDISQSGGGGSAMAATPTYEMADGVLDSDGAVSQVKNNENVIVVGGPNANSLTQELVDDNQSMPASDYTEGQGMIQMVDGWSSGNSALVVAGYQGEDTRAAAEFLADYRNNQDALEGQSEVEIETSTGSVVSN